jgi:hypothetical protein
LSPTLRNKRFLARNSRRLTGYDDGVVLARTAGYAESFPTALRDARRGAELETSSMSSSSAYCMICLAEYHALIGIGTQAIRRLIRVTTQCMCVHDVLLRGDVGGTSLFSLLTFFPASLSRLSPSRHINTSVRENKKIVCPGTTAFSPLDIHLSHLGLTLETSFRIQPLPLPARHRPFIDIDIHRNQ